MVPVANMTTDDRIKGRAVLFSCLYKAGETKLQIMYKVNGNESTKAQKAVPLKDLILERLLLQLTFLSLVAVMTEEV